METYRNRYRLPRQLLDTNTTIPQANGNKTTSANNGEATFDTNMVIILGAMLCAILCALGMTSIIRCALRCAGRLTYDTPEDIAARVASSEVKRDTLSQIPAVVYNSGMHIPATDCPICLAEFADGEDVRILPKCNHGFHVKCIDKWLELHSSCPTCRQSLIGGSRGGDAGHVSVLIRT